MRRVLPLLVLSGLLAAGEAAPAAGLTPDAAIARGLTALARLQKPDGNLDHNARITAIAGMAFLAGGHTPTRGAFREASGRCLAWVLSQQDPLTGYLGTDSHFGMYEHGFATLYLAEVYGMTLERKVRRSLEAAIDLIHKAQNSEGGWRYSPAPIEADISVTICQAMALRAAYNVGVGGATSKSALDRAVGYVRRCSNSDGSFGYMAGGRAGSWGTEGADGVPRAAAGAMTLMHAGIYRADDAVLGPALVFLRKHVEDHLRGQGNWYWYGQYYAAQAMFESPDRADWDRYWAKAWPLIVSRQGADGLWSGPDTSYGAPFNSAMALIILQIPDNYLPILLR